MTAILFVRVQSDLDWSVLEPRMMARVPRFREVPGLIQKIYGRDPASGAACGIYFFESREALLAFRESELARTIPSAFEATEVRPEVYELLFPLYPDRGPVPG
ncbi:MAG: YdhR family protein [Rhodocyclaceae bacterium]|nr:YdhR family protein [Rhodocyclaceae bacterium]